jgi:hypothetical protein
MGMARRMWCSIDWPMRVRQRETQRRRRDESSQDRVLAVIEQSHRLIDRGSVWNGLSLRPSIEPSHGAVGWLFRLAFSLAIPQA